MRRAPGPARLGFADLAVLVGARVYVPSWIRSHCRLMSTQAVWTVEEWIQHELEDTSDDHTHTHTDAGESGDTSDECIRTHTNVMELKGTADDSVDVHTNVSESVENTSDESVHAHVNFREVDSNSSDSEDTHVNNGEEVEGTSTESVRMLSNFKVEDASEEHVQRLAHIMRIMSMITGASGDEMIPPMIAMKKDPSHARRLAHMILSMMMDSSDGLMKPHMAKSASPESRKGGDMMDMCLEDNYYYGSHDSKHSDVDDSYNVVFYEKFALFRAKYSTSTVMETPSKLNGEPVAGSNCTEVLTSLELPSEDKTADQETQVGMFIGGAGKDVETMVTFICSHALLIRNLKNELSNNHFYSSLLCSDTLLIEVQSNDAPIFVRLLNKTLTEFITAVGESSHALTPCTHSILFDPTSSSSSSEAIDGEVWSCDADESDQTDVRCKAKRRTKKRGSQLPNHRCTYTNSPRQQKSIKHERVTVEPTGYSGSNSSLDDEGPNTCPCSCPQRSKKLCAYVAT